MSAATILAAIDAAIEALVTNKVSSYTVEDVTYDYNDLTKLRELRQYYSGLARTSGSRRRLGDIS